jgi:ABC-2 type transport system permease protein
MKGESIKRILVITSKEWLTVFKNRTVVLLALLLPLLLIALPLILLANADSLVLGTVSLASGELFQAVLANQFMLLLLIVALPLPAVIASHSILEEKRGRSFEPLLATPLSLSELLAGKVLAAALPGILSAWLSFVIYWLLASLLVLSDAVYNTILNSAWILAAALVAPSLTLLSVSLGLLVSWRSKDPRASGQLGLWVILPIVPLFAAQALGVSVVNPLIMLVLALILAGIDFWLLRLTRHLLQREPMLAR